MKQIWSEVSRGSSQDRNAKRSQIRRERDEGIAKLIRPEDRAAYEALLADYAAKNDAAEAAVKKEFDRAIERTREILTPEQRKKYDELMPRPGASGNRSTTRPTK
jgi:Spy/CpxP family protein refolding chaperone